MARGARRLQALVALAGPPQALKPRSGDADFGADGLVRVHGDQCRPAPSSTGEINAPDSRAAREAAARPRAAGDGADHAGRGRRKGRGVAIKKVKPKSLQIFSRQFATMIEAGLNVVTALVILEEQTEDRKLAIVIGELRADVEGGLLLSEAMARHPKIFSRLFIAMVEAGEAAGILDVVLDRVAYQIEKETKIKRRVKGAMMYPIMVLSFATLVLIGMLLFLVPIFVGHLRAARRRPADADADRRHGLGLPARHWFIVFPLVGARLLRPPARQEDREGPAGLGHGSAFARPSGIGKVIIKVGMARFSRTLSTLVAAGRRHHPLARDHRRDCRQQPHRGRHRPRPGARHTRACRSPSRSSEAAIFPPMVSHMVRVGEETGELEKMLTKIADFYEDEVDSAIATLTSIIEPLMMIAVGVVVGIIIIAMYLPMFKLLTLIQ